MIGVLIEMSEDGTSLTVKAPNGMPTALVLQIVSAGYHEILSRKVREDIDNSLIRLPRNRGPIL